MKKGWEVKKLDDVCIIKGRIGYRGYTKQDLVKKGEGAITLSPSNISDNKISYNNSTYISWFKYEESPEIMIFNGDILFVKTGSSYGKCALVNGLSEKATINPQFVVLKDIKCLNRYLYYFLITNGFKKEVDNIVGGSAIPTLSQAALGELSIPIPPPSEQKRIVAILDEAFDAIDKAKANAEQCLADSKELFESYLNGIFANPGEDWEEKKLGDVCESMEYGTSSKSKKEGLIPVIRMGNIQNGELNWDNLVFTDDKSEIKKYSLTQNDVLFNRTNSEELVGKTAIYRGERPAIFAGYLIRVNYKSDLLNPFFLNMWLNRKEIREYGYSVMTSSVNQANISGSKLKEYPIVLPPLPEQKQIVEKLNIFLKQTAHLDEIYKQKIADLDELKKSILQKAFEGEL